MKGQIIETAKPTRMELLNIRNRLELAEKGHKLLEDKRDALVEKFFDAVRNRDALKNEIDRMFTEAFDVLTEAQMIAGIDQVRSSSYLVEDIGDIYIETENIMGVKIPKIEKDKIKMKTKPFYSISSTYARLDDTKKRFSEILPKLMDLAEIDGSIQALADEIEKTKRRVNVLEDILIPRLESTKKYIEMQLEEREREDFFRRKRIKAIMERRENVSR